MDPDMVPIWGQYGLICCCCKEMCTHNGVYLGLRKDGAHPYGQDMAYMGVNMDPI